MREAVREIGEGPSDDTLALLAEANTFTPWYAVGELQFSVPKHRFLRPLAPLAENTLPVNWPGDAAGFLSGLCSAYGVDDVDALPRDVKLSALTLALVVSPDAFTSDLLGLLNLESIPVATVRDAARLAFETGNAWQGLELLRLTGVAFEEDLPELAKGAATPWPSPTVRPEDASSGSDVEAVYDFPALGMNIDRYDLFALAPYAPGAVKRRRLSREEVAQTRQFFRWCPRIAALDDALAAAYA
jgi:hypothetical protein